MCSFKTLLSVLDIFSVFFFFTVCVFEAFVIANSSKEELLFNLSSSVSRASSTPCGDFSELSQPITQVTILQHGVKNTLHALGVASDQAYREHLMSQESCGALGMENSSMAACSPLPWERKWRLQWDSLRTTPWLASQGAPMEPVAAFQEAALDQRAASSLSNQLQWEASAPVGSWAFCAEDVPELFWWRASRKMQNKIQSIQKTGRWLSCWIRCSRQRTGSGRAEELKETAELGKKQCSGNPSQQICVGDKMEKGEAGI